MIFLLQSPTHVKIINTHFVIISIFWNFKQTISHPQRMVLQTTNKFSVQERGQNYKTHLQNQTRILENLNKLYKHFIQFQGLMSNRKVLPMHSFFYTLQNFPGKFQNYSIKTKYLVFFKLLILFFSCGAFISSTYLLRVKCYLEEC